MSISAAEYQRRLLKVAQIAVLQNLMEQEIIKEAFNVVGLKEQDLLKGDIYGDGTLIPYKSESYAVLKESMNPLAGGAVDLMFTGAFLDAMIVKRISDNKYYFVSSDMKSPELTQEYGEGIFGLNQEKFDEFQVNVLAPKFIISLKQIGNIG